MSAKTDWFEAGWAVYKDGVRDAHCFPPLGERQAQRWWLGGFGAAWAQGRDETPIELALAKVVGERAALLAELLRHGGARRARTIH